MFIFYFSENSEIAEERAERDLSNDDTELVSENITESLQHWVVIFSINCYFYFAKCLRSLKWVSCTVAQANNHTHIPISIDISIKTHKFVCIRQIRWILDIIWPLNQTFKLKNQRNWLKQVWTLKFWSVINWFFMHWTKKVTLVEQFIRAMKDQIHF